MGSKNGGVFQIILGVALVIVGGIITGWSFGAASPFGTAIAGMGVSMILGGVIQLLTPVPRAKKGSDAPENAPSYTFAGAVNTQAQGNPVPLLYGRMIVGSAVISAGLNAEDYSPATTGVGGGYNSKDYDIDDDVFGWNPKTPYDDPPEAL